MITSYLRSSSIFGLIVPSCSMSWLRFFSMCLTGDEASPYVDDDSAVFAFFLIDVIVNDFIRFGFMHILEAESLQGSGLTSLSFQSFSRLVNLGISQLCKIGSGATVVDT